MPDVVSDDVISNTTLPLRTRNHMTYDLKHRLTSRNASWSGAVVKDRVAAALGNETASSGAGEPTNRPCLAAVDIPTDPWPAGAAEMEDWGERSLACPWPRPAGVGDEGPRRAVDDILLIMTGYALRKSGMEVDDVDDLAVDVVATLPVAVVVVVVGFMVAVANC